MARNVILTGVPRGGTTLTCHLLNTLPNAVALHEPMDPRELFGLSDESRVHEITKYFDRQRTSIIDLGIAESKTHGGKVPTNHRGDPDPVTGVRSALQDGHQLQIDKQVTADFTLFVKHPTLFSALSTILANSFEYYAIIRNPLATILSWQTANMPVTDGHAPVAEALDSKLADELGSESSRLQRQLMLMSWFFERYHCLPAEKISRYENVICSGGRSLGKMIPEAENLNHPLKTRNHINIVKTDDVRVLAERIISFGGAYLDYYTAEDILGVAEGEHSLC